jgi:hypothetical protein
MLGPVGVTQAHILETTGGNRSRNGSRGGSDGQFHGLSGDDFGRDSDVDS